jgi:hypothetical protein
MKKKEFRPGTEEAENGMTRLVDSDAWFKSLEDERKTLKWKLTRPFWVTKRIITDAPKEIKWTVQRILRGYSSCDIWNLFDVIAKKTLPMLIAFREMDRHGTPTCMWDNVEDSTEEEDKAAKEKWKEILDKMIYAFTFVVHEDNEKYREFLGIELKEGSTWRHKEGSYEAAYKKYEEGMNLFAKYFRSLWD